MLDLHTNNADMSETGEDRLVMYAQMATIVKQMVAPDEVDVREITQTICRVSHCPLFIYFPFN